MSTPLISPNENIAATTVAAMMGEKVLSSIRLATGDQHFEYIEIYDTPKPDYHNNQA